MPKPFWLKRQRVGHLTCQHPAVRPYAPCECLQMDETEQLQWRRRALVAAFGAPLAGLVLRRR